MDSSRQMEDIHNPVMDTTSSETLSTGSDVMAADMVIDTVMDTTSSEPLNTGSDVMAADMVIDTVMDRVMDTVMVKNIQVAATQTPVNATSPSKTSRTSRTSRTTRPVVQVQVMAATVMDGGSQWKATQAPLMTSTSCNTFEHHPDTSVGQTLDGFSSCSSLGVAVNPDDDDAPVCRICYLNDVANPELGPLRTLCSCRGTMAFVHLLCLERWLNESRSNRCELCGFRFKTRSTPTRALMPALASWVVQNATKLANQVVCFLLMTSAMVLGVRLTYEFITRADKNNVPWIERYMRDTISEKGRVWLARTVDCTVMNFESDMLGRYCVAVLRTVHADIRDWMRFWRSQSVIRIVIVEQAATSSVPQTSTTPVALTSDATASLAVPPDSPRSDSPPPDSPPPDSPPPDSPPPDSPPPSCDCPPSDSSPSSTLTFLVA